MAPAPALPSRYDSSELIARGGMAEVYRARDTLLGRLVAIKVLAAPFAADDEVRERFVREAQLAATLSGSRHVITVYDVGEIPSGPPYIVMELLEGGTLADRLLRGPVAPARALDWLEQAARGLDEAHARGIVHRDVKPGNLMLTRDGELQVTDFGIARAPDTSLTLTGTILGTSGYMSPEQARGEPATAASDRYALAVVAFEMLAGRRPFVGETQVSEAWAHATQPAPAATSLNAALPGRVDEVLARGLAKNPGARPGSCAALVEALRHAFLASEPVTARIRGVQSGPPVAARARRSRVGGPLAALGGVCVLVAAGAGVASLLADESAPPRAQTVVHTETVRGETQIRVRTETVRGETQTRTVTVAAETTVEAPATAAPSEPPPSTAQPAGEGTRTSGAALNDRGYRLLQDGDVAAALPYFERAVELLDDSGSLAEAYASYNLALARLSLGSCDGVIQLLDRSQQVQGERSEITRLRRNAERRCGDDDG